MASISRQKNGRKTIQFVASDEKRRSLRLGKISLRNAESVKVHVERLVTASLTGHSVEDETARWVATLDPAMADKLARVGLVAKREKATLGAFIDSYMTSRSDVKPRTQTLYKQTRNSLVAYFEEDTLMRDITAGDADEWRLHLLDTGLSENTVRRRCGRAKQFFKAAMRKGLIPSNPFVDLKCNVQANKDKFYYVSREEAAAILDACPNAEWRLIFALSRYAGLRCPSEHLGLRWDDIDWVRGRMHVRSPKTEHHVGGESRVVPIFPELRPFLQDCDDLAETGAEFVITRYRDTNANLRTQLIRIIKRAGLKPWPKLFQNLRSTRETELTETFPIHVVCAWIGNSQPVAMKHYLQVTDEHFEQAIKEDPKAVQNPVQQAAVSPRTDSHSALAAQKETPVLQGCASGCDYLHDSQVPPQGLEP